MHKEQQSIIKNLIFTPSLTFSKLNTNSISSDSFNFHVKQLVKNKYIMKLDNGEYCLTEKGKELSLRVGAKSKVVSKQGVIGVVVLPVKKINGVTKYLIQQWLKSQFYGVYGFVSGKVDMFETTEQCAKRELKEETGLSGGKWSFLGTHHSIKGYKKKHPVIDHYFYLYRVDFPLGKTSNTEEGENFWLSEKEIKKLEPTFPDFDFMFNTFKSASNIGLVERFYKLENF